MTAPSARQAGRTAGTATAAEQLVNRAELCGGGTSNSLSPWCLLAQIGSRAHPATGQAGGSAVEKRRSGGFTTVERTHRPGERRPYEMRRSFQRVMEEQFTAVVEEATGRKVIAYMSQIHDRPRSCGRDLRARAGVEDRRSTSADLPEEASRKSVKVATVLAISEDAATAIRGIVGSPGVPEGAGLRITQEVNTDEGGSRGRTCGSRSSPRPQEGDEVLEDGAGLHRSRRRRPPRRQAARRRLRRTTTSNSASTSRPSRDSRDARPRPHRLGSAAKPTGGSLWT